MEKEVINVEEQLLIVDYLNSGRERDLVGGCTCWFDNGDFEFDTNCPVHFAKELDHGVV